MSGTAWRRVRRVAVLLVIVGPLRWGWDYATSSELRLSLHDAAPRRSLESGLGQGVETVGGEGKVAIFAHPPSRLEWRLDLRPGRHRFEAFLALQEAAFERSDGVGYRVAVVEKGREETLLEAVVDPRGREEDRRWVRQEGSFRSEGGAVVLALETGVGPRGGNDFDWALWGEPRVLEGAEPPFWPPIAVGVILLVVATGRLRRSGERSRPASAWALVVGLVVGLGLVELLFRAEPRLFPAEAYHQLARNGLCEVGEHNALRVPDPELGFRLPPDRCDSYRRQYDAVLEEQVSTAWLPPDETEIRFCTDHQGFRNDPGHAEPAVVVVGDSFIQGALVPREALLTTVLADASGLPVRNLGVGGYAPRQSLLALERYGLDPLPRTVVLALYEGNDVQDEEQLAAWRGSGMEWGRFLAAGREAHGPTQVIPRYRHSFAAATLLFLGERASTALRRVSAAVDFPELPAFNPVCGEIGGEVRCFAFTRSELQREALSEEAWRSRPGWTLLRGVLEELSALARQRGFTPRVALLPTKSGLYLPLLDGGYDPRVLDRFVDPEGESEGPLPSEALRANSGSLHRSLLALLQEVGLEAIDLRPAFEEAARRGELLYLPFDSHWNEAGHRLAGEVMVRHVSLGSPGAVEVSP